MTKYVMPKPVFKRYTREDEKEGLIPENLRVGRIKYGEWSDEHFDELKDATWEWVEYIKGEYLVVYLSETSWDIHIESVHGEDKDISENAEKWFEKFDKERSEEMIDIFGEARDVKIFITLVDEKAFVSDMSIGDFWLKRDHVEAITTKLKLTPVPLMYEASLSSILTLMQNDIKDSFVFEGKKAEGLVGSPKLGILDRLGGKISALIKYSDF